MREAGDQVFFDLWDACLVVIAIFEVIRMTPEIEEVINKEPTVPRILAAARAQGALTMRQDGILKALDGIVSIDEVIEETEEV